jgi:hypothetical protein
MILQSEKFNEELRARLRDSGADADDTTSTSGLIYNTWMDIVYSEEKEPEADIRNFCRQMEDTFAEGYEAALKNTVTAYPVEYDMIKRQKSELEHSGGLPGL